MDLKKAQEYIKALKNGEKFPKKNMFLIMFLLGALLFVIVLPTGSSAPTSEKGGLDENKRKVYAIGELGLKQALMDKGFRFEEVTPDYVVVGLDYDVTYHKFELATLAIKRGAKFIGTNPDTNLPNERGLVPGAGSVIALVERATQQVATYVGKPEKIIMEKALKKMNMKADDVIMVGDNYNTDIKAGIASDIDTLLVYTGVSTREDVAKEKIKPTYEINSLDEWQ